MPATFIYNHFVTGKNFFGRKQEISILSNMLFSGENIVIYEPPKTGKTSLVQQTFFNMKISSQFFTPVEFSMLSIRSVSDFACEFASKVIRSFATTPSEYADAVSHYFEGTHFVFDEDLFVATDKILTLNWELDENDLRSVLTLPYRVAEERNTKLYVILHEFQNALLFDDPDLFLKTSEAVMKANPNGKASYILIGSQVNAMKEIFEHRHLFHRLVERIELPQMDTKEVIEFAVKGFLTNGKVLDKDLMLGACKLFRGHLWYINHFCAIADSLSRGYIMEPVLVEALDVLISIHEPEFSRIMNDLTTYQVSLFRAVLEGHTKFSSSEVISRYGLNSSANVRRLKDALCKKEIITFDERDEPIVLDPLFEYWARTFYFGIK